MTRKMETLTVTKALITPRLLWRTHAAPASLTFFTTDHHRQHPPPIMPHQFSARAQVIRDLFINLVFLNHEEGNDLVDSALGIRTVPTIGQILHPNDSYQALIFNLIIGEEAQIEDCLAWVLSRRYLDTRSPGRFQDKYDLALLFDACDADFKQAVCTTKEGFCWVMEKIFLHPIFYNNSNRHQLPIAHQLALTLERLGSNGNGASVG
ncbi:hypothetical protein PCANC_28396 [Puccinia coronata f. sp. avenae]|uniref:Uncharacterized protein n=1 Tax=Puccinia coronata f. sp. avenae TaxID=200324 RepID=A0A2N5RYF7_9BASI|nr:hypothetical protein PCANC_28396 [Puccinia coronata f. sp. avenae]